MAEEASIKNIATKKYNTLPVSSLKLYKEWFHKIKFKSSKEKIKGHQESGPDGEVKE